MNCSDCKYVRNCETTPDTNADECETFVKLERNVTMPELERQIAKTKIECLEDFRTNLLCNLKADERTQIYRNFTEHVAIVTKAMIKEEKERLGL